eukprot:Awhi_evm2s6304
MHRGQSHSVLNQGHFLSYVKDNSTIYAILVSGKLGKSCVESYLLSITLLVSSCETIPRNIGNFLNLQELIVKKKKKNLRDMYLLRRDLDRSNNLPLDLHPLLSLSSLKELELDSFTGVSNFGNWTFKRLVVLKLRGDFSFEPQTSFPNLQNLSLASNDHLSNLQILENCKQLKHLALSFCTEVESIDSLTYLLKLESLMIRGLYKLKTCNAVTYLNNLSSLDFQNRRPVIPTILLNLTKLEKLIISDAGCQNLNDFDRLTNLKVLDITSRHLTTLEPLLSLTQLHTLTLQQTDKLEDLTALLGMKNLQHLTFVGRQRGPDTLENDGALRILQEAFINLKTLKFERIEKSLYLRFPQAWKDKGEFKLRFRCLCDFILTK